MSNARSKVTVFLAITLGVATPVGVLIAAAAALDLQKARHDHYHELGDAFKTVRDESRAGAPDMAKIRAAAQVIHEASVDQGRWFPAGTGPEAGKTRALPQIWQRPEDSLDRLGWSAWYSQQLTLEDLNAGFPARVSRVQRNALAVLCERGVLDQVVPPRLLASAIAIGV